MRTPDSTSPTLACWCRRMRPALLGTFLPASGQAQSSAVRRTATGIPDFTGNLAGDEHGQLGSSRAHEARHGPVVRWEPHSAFLRHRDRRGGR